MTWEPLPSRHRWIFRVCLGSIVALVGARALHHASTSLPVALDRIIGGVINVGVLEAAFAMALGPVFALAVAGTLAIALLRRRPVLMRDGRRIGTVPWLHSAVWLCVLLGSPALDAVPPVALAFWSTLPLLGATSERLLGRHSRWWAALLGLPICAAWLPFAPDEFARRAIVCWAGAFLALSSARTWLPRGSDRLWLAASIGAAVQMFLAIPPQSGHGGEMLGDDGYAYTFCEPPGRDRLYAAVTCDSVDHCARGYVAEHDLRDLSSKRKLVFFDEGFDGRVVQLACAGDVVQVSMVNVRIGDQRHAENVLEFQIDDPSRFERSVLGGEMGTTAVYDREHDAFFYASDSRKRIFRLDRRSGELKRDVADALYGTPVSEKDLGSHNVNIHAFHRGRDSLFISQWISGSRIFELDRSSLALIGTYDPMNGGNHGVAVDDELDRIWAASAWGVDVLGIPDGQSLARAWLGAGSRIAAIDRTHDLVFVSVTIEGRIWIFDRRSLEVLGTLPIGRECRHAEVSADGRRLYASNNVGYYVWNIDEIARSLRAGDPRRSLSPASVRRSRRASASR